MIQQLLSGIHTWKNKNTNSKRYMHPNVRSSIFTIAKNTEATQFSINRQMDKEEGGIYL